jgi:hypothetical protein
MKKGTSAIHGATFFFYKKGHGAAPLQTISKIAWSKCDNSSELSNFDAILKIIFFFLKMLTADRRRRKREKRQKQPHAETL